VSDPNARDWETISYVEHDDGVAVVTLNRPDVHNAFNRTMQRELHDLWRALRLHDPVRCIVLTGAGDKSFCTGIDRAEQMGGDAAALDDDEHRVGFASTPFHFDDPGDWLGPKTADLWKPVVAAVNGMACGGAFYLLGEVEFIIAADHATFFDPHVTYGMCATIEPIHMMQRMPFGEIMRMSLMGNHERLSAERAHQIGLVSEVVPGSELLAAATRCASAIASAPALAVEGTVRSIWAGLELTRSQALSMGGPLVGLGTSEASLAEGQAAFTSGKRIEWRLR
jgi:enoyl-CoA hydratase/carnithine racemase